MKKEVYGIIYLVHNIKSDKYYVGQTTSSFDKRYKSGWLYEHSLKDTVQADLEKYGESSFEYIKRFKVAYSKEDLDKLEAYYIKYYNSYENGYNETRGNMNRNYDNKESVKSMKKVLFTSFDCYENGILNESLVREGIQYFLQYLESSINSYEARYRTNVVELMFIGTRLNSDKVTGGAIGTIMDGECDNIDIMAEDNLITIYIYKNNSCYTYNVYIMTENLIKTLGCYSNYKELGYKALEDEYYIEKLYKSYRTPLELNRNNGYY